MELRRLSGISTQAVEHATCHGWDEWLSILDDAGAADWDHKQIVAFLKEEHDVSPWWQQAVAVAYEKARGRRVTGETADAGVQLGVQKSLPLPLDEAWALISSRAGVAIWLGPAARFSLQEGKRYSTESGVEGEVRVVKPGDRVRLTWRSPEMDRPATLQIGLIASAPDRTTVRIHMERLPSLEWRERMKEHWRGVLRSLEQLAAR